jgi:RNA polymerase sigma factor (sigma-70 family)
MDYVKFLYRPLATHAAMQALVGRERTRGAPERGRYARSDVDALLKTAWSDYAVRVRKLPAEPTVGSRMNVRLACFTMTFFNALLAAGAERAYEAVHEAFIAAWAALRRYDPDRSFGAWLRTIAINKARDRGRRLAFRRLLFGTHGLEQTAALDVEDPATAADQVVMDDQLAAQVDREIQRLPSALKEAFLLTGFEGCSHQEAGRILGVSAKTIETRAYRARKLLACRLDNVLQPSAARR